MCCLWPIASAGGYNAGIEDNNFYNDFDITRIQDKGTDENLATREKIMDRWFDLKTGTGIVEVPTLIGMNPDTVAELGPQALALDQQLRYGSVPAAAVIVSNQAPIRIQSDGRSISLFNSYLT